MSNVNQRTRKSVETLRAERLAKMPLPQRELDSLLLDLNRETDYVYRYLVHDGKRYKCCVMASEDTFIATAKVDRVFVVAAHKPSEAVEGLKRKLRVRIAELKASGRIRDL